jgi:hypothetical protein
MLSPFDEEEFNVFSELSQDQDHGGLRRSGPVDR